MTETQSTIDFAAVERRLSALESELDRLGLQAHERELLLLLHRDGRRDGDRAWLELTFRSISRRIGCSDRWARDARDSLVERGLLESYSQGVGRACVLSVCWSTVFSHPRVERELDLDRFRRLRAEYLSTSEVPAEAEAEAVAELPEAPSAGQDSRDKKLESRATEREVAAFLLSDKPWQAITDALLQRCDVRIFDRLFCEACALGWLTEHSEKSRREFFAFTRRAARNRKSRSCVAILKSAVKRRRLGCTDLGAQRWAREACTALARGAGVLR